MLNFSRRTKIFLGLGVLALGGFVAITLAGSSSEGVPQAFSDARLQGALIAQNIVVLSNESAQDLEKINQLDKEGNFTEALTLVTAAVARSQEIRDEAVRLSAELEKMTTSLSEISSLSARQAALEAIGDHLALINRLINYSGYLAQLLEVLRNRFLGNFSDRNQVEGLIRDINAEVEAINSFSVEASEAIDRFDALIR